MINAVIVQNYLGEAVSINLANPYDTGFAITSIDGLSSGDADINTTDIATTDGSYYNSSRIPSRNIAINFRLLPCPTMEDTRHRLYKLFQTKRWTRLYFLTETRYVYIEGYVEKNETQMFSEGVVSQVSIVCPDPFFKDINETSDIFSGVVANFQFPFQNSGSTPAISMGSLLFYSEKNIYYSGEDETGFVIRIHVIGTVGADVSIYNVKTYESMTLYYSKLVTATGSGLINGDDVTINTRKGEKSITLLRNGTTTNILNCINRNADWFQLSTGDNVFTYTCTSGLLNLQFSASHRAIYNGV